MNTDKLLQATQKIEELENSEHDLFKIISLLNKAYTSLATSYQGLATSSDSNVAWKNLSNSQASTINIVQTAIRNAPFSITIKSIELLKSELSRHSIPAFIKAITQAESFTSALDDQLHNHNLNTSISLARAAHYLTVELDKISAIGETLKETTAKDLATNKETIKIYFPNHIDLESFASKTTAISIIIEECCRLVGMSTIEAEVDISKIESGSYFAAISANPLVLAIVTALITNGAVYLFNNLDPHKEAIALKENTETLEKILNIRNELEKNNIETKNLDEEIKKSTTKIAKQLDKLIGDDTELEINDNKISTHKNNLIGNNAALLSSTEPPPDKSGTAQENSK